jgi:hypothetical protein
MPGLVNDRVTLFGMSSECDDDIPKPVGGASIMRECDESPPPLLREGIAQFNRGEYFEQHETFELRWRAEQREARRLYQGILQIGVAFHHLRRRNYHGTVYMLTRGALPDTVLAAMPGRRCRDAPDRCHDCAEGCRAARARSARGFRLATRADSPPGLLTELSECQRIPNCGDPGRLRWNERLRGWGSSVCRPVPSTSWPPLSSPMLSKERLGDRRILAETSG